MINNRHEYEKMAAVETDHWWYQSLHQQVAAYLKSHFPEPGTSILDAGCGTGGMLSHLRTAGFKNLRGFDLSSDAVEFCTEQELDVVQGNLAEIDTLYGDQMFDVIISNDTLYFFDPEEGRKLAEKLVTLLRPGGSLIANVPALQVFSGIHDISVGINGRFTRARLKAMFSGLPVTTVRLRYWPFLLSPLILISRLLQKAKLKINPDCEIKSDIDLPNPLINRFLLWICQFENTLLPTCFGSSLLLIVTRD